MDKNPTKKCPKCQIEISTLAKKCPHCQSKIPQAASPLMVVLVGIIGIGIITSTVITALDPTPRAQTVVQEDPKVWARVYAEIDVERLLKSPSTADFCRPTIDALAENKYKITSCVDSQNSYGAMIRSNWEVTMVYSGSDAKNAGSWKTEEVIFDGEVVY